MLHYTVTLHALEAGSAGGGMWVCGLDWAGPGQGQVVDACECGNEPSVSIKCGEFSRRTLHHGVSKYML
jgi:hypothetical protein